MISHGDVVESIEAVEVEPQEPEVAVDMVSVTKKLEAGFPLCQHSVHALRYHRLR
jgi:hypothetical protein